MSVVNPATNTLVGVIRLGDPVPKTLDPLYRGQLLVHGMGLSPDHRTLDVVSAGSNSVTFIDTATNKIKHITYVGRSPHEAMFTPDGREVWVTVRGENYVQVLDGKTYEPKLRITVPNGPGMTIFSPDNKYGYVCSSFVPETEVIDVHTHEVVGSVKQASTFCPNIAATPDGRQVWFTLKDTGRTQVINAGPPFNTIAVLDTGPITNHVNFVRNAYGQFAYVSIGGRNEVKVYTTSNQPHLCATIHTGELPHGVWPSGDGTRVYVGLENSDALTAINTLTNKVVAVVHSGQSPQGIAYIPDAVPQGDGTANLTPLGAAGQAVHFTLGAQGKLDTTVAVNNQGLTDLLHAGVSGLQPMQPYFLALSGQVDGSGPLLPIAKFTANASGTAVVQAVGSVRVANTAPDGHIQRRYLVISPIVDGKPGTPVQTEIKL